MKKFFGLVLVAFMACGVAFAALDVYTGSSVKTLLASATVDNQHATVTSTTGTSVDVFGGKGIGVALISVNQGTVTGSVTVALQHSANGTAWVALTNYGTVVATTVTGSNALAATYSHKIDLNNVRRYVRAVASGTNSAYSVTATLVYPQ